MGPINPLANAFCQVGVFIHIMLYKVTQEMHTVTIVTVNDKIGQLQSSHILSWLFNDQFFKLKVENNLFATVHSEN
jgi:hypothetical protein